MKTEKSPSVESDSGWFSVPGDRRFVRILERTKSFVVVGFPVSIHDMAVFSVVNVVSNVGSDFDLAVFSCLDGSGDPRFGKSGVGEDSADSKFMFFRFRTPPPDSGNVFGLASLAAFLGDESHLTPPLYSVIKERFDNTIISNGIPRKPLWRNGYRLVGYQNVPRKKMLDIDGAKVLRKWGSPKGSEIHAQEKSLAAAW